MSVQRFEMHKIELRERLEADPHDKEALFELGQAFMDEHDPAEALTWFREATQLDPDNACVANSMGDACSNLELYEEAKT